jgi:hypothetical protein
MSGKKSQTGKSMRADRVAVIAIAANVLPSLDSAFLMERMDGGLGTTSSRSNSRPSRLLTRETQT